MLGRGDRGLLHRRDERRNGGRLDLCDAPLRWGRDPLLYRRRENA